ncbi:protein of unknown function (DUF1814) [Bernardetia litoralis DSM 6794]|uniref:Uncharacterized protein n=1 Tax=Bernardetia litoralis (strain ATCC 23117 / DSM 6794 / NBRC 15988 / NCIMB 1366 / Fx l1 / Sio-4) TaxID=880071 RepID=I4AJT5_BERLS|nr:nucleotidyl transferase AbiEii/AbiGii toxin family protein [Bernardetia litoralis]AFM04220.1 protein of unknown function (DUF1814) [Bernardetia litoralis DSM 6794]
MKENKEDEHHKIYILEQLLEAAFSIPSIENLVIFRGSLLTKNWIQDNYYRSVSDLDFLAIADYDRALYINFIKKTLQKTQENSELLKQKNNLEIDINSLKTEDTWVDTENPSFRFQFDVKLNNQLFENIQIDIAFGDTLVLPPLWKNYNCIISKKNITVFSVQTEQALAWKAHGLFDFYDRGGRWQSKDLYDVFCILKTQSIQKEKFQKCILVAFEDKKTPISLSYLKMKNDTFGKSKGSQKKWDKFLTEKLNYQNDKKELELNNVIRVIKEFLDPFLGS